MKTRFALLASMAVIVATSMLMGQGPGPGGPPPCMEDCRDIEDMGGIDGNDPYCWKFEHVTGRLVHSTTAAIGGTPTLSSHCGETTQTIDVYSACTGLCAPDNVAPQEVNQTGNVTGTTGFGCWECSGP